MIWTIILMSVTHSLLGGLEVRWISQTLEGAALAQISPCLEHCRRIAL